MDLTMGPGSRNRNDFNGLVVVVLKKNYTPTTHRKVFHGV